MCHIIPFHNAGICLGGPLQLWRRVLIITLWLAFVLTGLRGALHLSRVVFGVLSPTLLHCYGCNCCQICTPSASWMHCVRVAHSVLHLWNRHSPTPYQRGQVGCLQTVSKHCIVDNAYFQFASLPHDAPRSNVQD